MLFAQSTQTKNKPPVNSGLDLPIEPTWVGKETESGPPGEDIDEEAPRDGEPPPVFYGEEIDTENDTIVYVLDISCSMGWDNQTYTTLDGGTAKGNRLARAKAEVGRSIMGLSENFRFNVIAYNCGTRQWAQELLPADEGNKNSALAWVFALNEGGGTGTGPATALGLSFKENNNVILLTDGAPNCGASGIDGHRQMIRSANTQGAVIDVFGISASGQYRSFCQSVASDSGGSYFDVP